MTQEKGVSYLQHTSIPGHGPQEERTPHLQQHPRAWLAARGRVPYRRDSEDVTGWTYPEASSEMEISIKEVYYWDQCL